MAFQAGIIHLVDFSVRQFGPQNLNSPKEIKTPSPVTKDTLVSLSPSAPVKKKQTRSVHFEEDLLVKTETLQNALTMRDLKTIRALAPQVVLHSKEGLNNFIFPACETWNPEVLSLLLDAANPKHKASIAKEILYWLVENCDLRPPMVKSYDDLLFKLLGLVDFDEMPEDEKVGLAKDILKHPDLSPIFDALLLNLGGKFFVTFVNEAMDHSNLDALLILLDSEDAHDLSQFSWGKIARKCLDTEALTLLARILPFLKGKEPLYLYYLVDAKKWEIQIVFFNCQSFCNNVRNNWPEYKTRLKEIADYSVEDSQYFNLFASVITFFEKKELFYYHQQALLHGNFKAAEFLNNCIIN